MPKAYVLGQLTIQNPDGYAQYSQYVPETVAKHGGKYLVRWGGNSIQLEGVTQGNRKVVIEFPNRDAAVTWYNSPEYQAILPIRLANSDGHISIVEGYED